MGFIIRLVYYLIIWGLGIALFLFVVRILFGGSTRDEAARIEKKKEQLRAELDALKPGLVPAGDEELKMLDKNLQSIRVKGAISKGYFSTLYQEPILAYCMHKEIDKNILIAQSTQKEYCLIQEGPNTKVFLQNELFGTIDSDFRFYIREPKEVKAFVDVTSYPQYDVIKIADEPIVYLHSESKPDTSSSSNRLYAMYNELEAADKDILISLTLFYTLIKTNKQA